MSGTRHNPFIIGDWIKRDEDFMGRADLVADFIRLQHHLIWLIGARRMGKTSLLRRVQRQLQSGGLGLAIFWDVSGSRTAEDLRETLLDALAAAASELAAIGLVLAQCEAEKNLLALLRRLYTQAVEARHPLVLLLDESEALMQIAAQEEALAQKLTAFFTASPRLFVIMASNHGLAAWDELDTRHLISPFLQPFMPPVYLPPWSAEEALAVTARTAAAPAEQLEIINASGGLPFLVQLCCFYRFESGDWPSALARLEREQMLDLFFRDDFNHFDAGMRQLLALISRQGGLSAARVAEWWPSQRAAAQRLDLLQRLGFIRRDANGEVRISNLFLDSWIQQVYLPGNPLHAPLKLHSESVVPERLLLRFEPTGLRLQYPAGIGRQHSMVPLPPNFPAMHPAAEDAPEAELDAGGRALYEHLFQIDRAHWDEVLQHQPACHLVFSGAHIDLGVEGLHDGAGYLALTHPLYREESGLARLPRPLQQDGKLKILLIASDTPPGLGKIDDEILLLSEHIRRGREAMGASAHIQCLYSHSGSLAGLERVARDAPFDIIHYSGHLSAGAAAAVEYLYFRLDGRPDSPVHAMTIDEFIRRLGPVQLLYLSGCGLAGSRGSAAAHPGGWARYVVRLRGAVSDEEAAQFALHFYQSLFDCGLDPVAAMQESRKRWFARPHTDAASRHFAFNPVLFHFC